MSDPGSGSGRPVAVVAPRRGVRAAAFRLVVIIAALLTLAYLAASWAARLATTPHPTLHGVWPQPPLVIAHQGGDGLWPSNTRLAFDRAARLGVDVLEMDVHLAADGELVVIHDDTVDRTTDAVGAVVELDTEALSSVDAGYAWSPERDGGRQPYRGAGVGVPRLVDVLRDHPAAPLLIEIKPPGPQTAGALCATLRRDGRVGDAVVASFHEDATAAFRAACPEVATGATPNEVRTFLVLARLRLAGPYRPPFEVLQVPVRQGSITIVTPAFVRAAHAKGVQVQVWTIDDADEMRRLFDMGVDGVITDRPDRALAVTGRSVPEDAVPSFVAP